MNAEELQRFSQHQYVHLGNHTRHHSILTNYSEEEAYQEMALGIRETIPHTRATQQKISKAGQIGYQLTLFDQADQPMPTNTFVVWWAPSTD